MMRACSKCGVVKTLGEFNRQSRNLDGLRKECRACQSAYNAGRYASNPDRFKEAVRSYARTNVDAVKEGKRKRYLANRNEMLRRHAAYYAQNRAKKDAYRRRYAKANPKKERDWSTNCRLRAPEKHAARTALRAARKKRATPAWANLELVGAYYTMAAWLTQETGVPHHVDHIEPLRGKHVCGLHNEFNLQVLPARVNIAKSNRPSDVVGLR